MANNQKKKATTYTYESVDGTKSTIQVGQDGVTKQWLAFLMESDADMVEQDDYQQKHADYNYQNAVRNYERNPDAYGEHPMDRFEDPAADIFSILFPDIPEDAHGLLKEKLEAAMSKLTDDQIDLIRDLYGLCKTNVQAGKERNITEAAIRCRRDKIHRRLKKLIDD